MTLVDQKDAAPRRGERETKGGNETDGEERLEGPAKRDLAESNSKDLEYQKGTLSEQLKTISERLERTSE